MPLRDHFRPPLDDLRHWEGFHATWPVMIVAQLRHRLPPGYFAEPRVHLGSTAEIDVASFEDDGVGASSAQAGNGNGGVGLSVGETSGDSGAVAVAVCIVILGLSQQLGHHALHLVGGVAVVASVV